MIFSKALSSWTLLATVTAALSSLLALHELPAASSFTPTSTVISGGRHHRHRRVLPVMQTPDGSTHDASSSIYASSTGGALSMASAEAASEASEAKTTFDAKQLDFTMGYLNKHHSDVLLEFAVAFTKVGTEQAQKNAFSGGSYNILDAKLVAINYDVNNDRSGDNFLTLDVTVKLRKEKQSKIESVTLPLDANPTKALSRVYDSTQLVPPPSTSTSLSSNTNHPNHIDDFIRRFNRLCLMVKKPQATGKLIQLGFQIGGAKVGLLKEDLYLNQVPHNRYVRQYFYDMAAQAALDAVIACSESGSKNDDNTTNNNSAYPISNRMKMTALFPEMNPSMDSYRIGTLLELARQIAITLAEQNLRVRICVQGSMGVGIFTGTPKQLSGANVLLTRMDWQSNEGEENEGMVGNYINFGAVGKEHVVNARTDRRGNEIHQDDVFLILCPQSMIGVDSSIIASLEEMTVAAGDRPVILLNPDLVDKVSAQGQQNIRGRKERMDFADSFKTVFHFQNIYVSGTSYFPILGAITKPGPREPWIAYQRRDRLNDEGEVYVPVLSSEEMPEGEAILSTFD